MRIGHGFDAHQFSEGDHIVVGGVVIPFSKGIAAHSDGDVVIHALCDALLGALGLGDIGMHFPDSDPSLKGCDSRLFLRQIQSLVKQSSYALSNLDCTIVCERPKMAKHFEAMRQNLSTDLEVPYSKVNVKATTTEQLGFVGREEGIAAFAVVLLEEDKF